MKKRLRLVPLLLTALVAYGVSAGPIGRVDASHEASCAAQANPSVPGSVSRANILVEVVEDVTGITPIGKVCNPNLYGEGNWDTEAELRPHVTAHMVRCGFEARDKRLVQAVIEVTGEPAVHGACIHALYQDAIKKTRGPGASIDFNSWDTQVSSVYGARPGVRAALEICATNAIAQLVFEQIAALPKRSELVQPTVGGSDGEQFKGQCQDKLYFNGLYQSVGVLREAMRLRTLSTQNCGGVAPSATGSQSAQITQAYLDLTGWRPAGGECTVGSYAGGVWSSYTELKNLVYHSLRCSHHWLGQAYLQETGRAARGRGSRGECNIELYRGWTDYPSLRANVAAMQTSLANRSASFSGTGNTLTVNGAPVDVEFLRVLTFDGRVSTGAGNIISEAGGVLIGQAGGNVISTGGGNVISTGGGNVISTGGGNFAVKR